MSCSAGSDLSRLVLFLLVAIVVLTSQGSAQFVNRAARRTRVGCAQWGQACLGGHFKKRTSEVSSTNELPSATDQIPKDQLQAPVFRSRVPYPFQLRGWPSETPRWVSLEEGLLQEPSEMGLGGLGQGVDYPRNKLPYDWRLPFLGVAAR